MKKHGTIHVYINYRDVDHAYPKENYPNSFIDHIFNDCADREIYSFMDGFSGYNQVNILPTVQYKTTFICPWGTFSDWKLPFGLKNVGATFQQEMDYAFHDIKHIM